MTGFLPGRLLHAAERGELIKRAIPKTGEKLPIVGLGSSASFRRAADGGDVGVVRDVIRALLDNGGTVFDTAPSYGASEKVAGQVVQDLGATDKVFWATKLNVVPRGGTSADPDEARAQAERSFSYIGKDPIDLIQVHNLQDVPTQLEHPQGPQGAGAAALRRRDVYRRIPLPRPRRGHAQGADRFHRHRLCRR